MIINLHNSDYRFIFGQYPDKYFDWIIADIPYGLQVTKMAYNRVFKKTVLQKNGNRLNPFKNKKQHDLTNWDSVVPDQDYFDLLQRISKNQIIFGIDYTNWQNVGTGRIIWNKGVAQGMSFKSTETAYCSSIEHEHTIDLLFSGMMQARSINKPMVQQGDKSKNEKRNHPCYKPVMLYDILYRDFVKDINSIVGDTHLGGGSHLVAAHKFGINEFVATEINKNYFDATTKKYNDFIKTKAQLQLFE